MSQIWTNVSGRQLAQGDWVPYCAVPIFDENVEEVDIVQSLFAKRLDLIVLTQSCDLLNMKAGLVALSPVFSVSIFEQANPKFATKGVWEEVRKGRREGLYLSPSPT